MSTSDSDYSIDWLASDEDDYDGPTTLIPQLAEELPSSSPPSSSSSSSSLSSSGATATSCRESPTSCFHSGAQRKRRRSHCREEADSPVQGFTSVCEEAELRSSRKRPGGDASAARTDSEDELFSRKRSELQRYVQPLSSILRGLRSGRYSERLSGFQESVAMDRIQRIMGVLQNPNTGGRFLSIVLKIEEMLQSWFPHIGPDLNPTDDGTPAKRLKQHHGSAPPPPAPPPPPLPPPPSYSSTHLKWLHASPVGSPKTPEASPSGHREATQDNAVSSSTDSPAGPRPPFKIRSPCLERLLQAKESIIAPRRRAAAAERLTR
ncbi:circadian-associated transcriptional repressor-like isoform X2 [Brachyistius frenatus]|uniref:circadian-associated transcriptional repressor-like isoform X2 n=1 Tax=Brachyistius frenatus TaxID=100188 RepID=UPI0037E7FB86